MKMSETIKIVLTGPESVGKSTLTKQLADYFKVPYVSEIAREYISNLKRPYNIDDVVEIAGLQIAAEKEALSSSPRIVFFDTDLIITKIWLLHVYGQCPSWIDEELRQNPAYFHLLCYYDLPWEPDPVRENPDIRSLLYDKYEAEINNYGLKYGVVKGLDNNRFLNAIALLRENHII